MNDLDYFPAEIAAATKQWLMKLYLNAANEPQ
jgi:hypothetical protein